MASRWGRRPLAIVALGYGLVTAACGRAQPPTPSFARAEVVRGVEGGSACAACVPRQGEQVESCHLGSLEPALLARREALGDQALRREAMVCLYRGQP